MRTLLLILASTLPVNLAFAQPPADLLDQYMDELADRSTEPGQERPPASKFHRLLYRGQNLTEQGLYSEAAQTHRDLLATEMPDFWRSKLTRRLAIIEAWAESGVTSLEDYRVFHLEISEFHRRLRPVVALWAMPRFAREEKLWTVCELLKAARLKEGMRLAFEALAQSSAATDVQRAEALLALGILHYEDSDLQQADRAWLQVGREFRNTPAWGKAMFNLGLSRKEQGDATGAIRFFTTLRNSDANDREPGGSLMQPYRNYRPGAQWEIAMIYFEQARYRKALDAFHIGETLYPWQSWCGNEIAAHAFRSAFYQALSHQRLREPRHAASFYFRAWAASPGSTLGLACSYVSTVRREPLIRSLPAATRLIVFSGAVPSWLPVLAQSALTQTGAEIIRRTREPRM